MYCSYEAQRMNTLKYYFLNMKTNKMKQNIFIPTPKFFGVSSQSERVVITTKRGSLVIQPCGLNYKREIKRATLALHFLRFYPKTFF